jgi:hypothetical protein
MSSRQTTSFMWSSITTFHRMYFLLVELLKVSRLMLKSSDIGLEQDQHLETYKVVHAIESRFTVP